MDPSDSGSRYVAIDAKLESLIAGLPAPPSWTEAWHKLRPESTAGQRLAVYQAIRDSGVLPADAGFYLVAWEIDTITDHRAETALSHLDDRLRAIEAAHGLEEDEFWEPGEAPAEYRDALERYDQAWDELFAAQLEEHGESEIAALFQTDPEEFDRRSEVGRRFFHEHETTSGDKPHVPDWLNDLFDIIAAALLPESLIGPLGFRWRSDEDFWEIDAYPAPVELVGGADDGAVVTPGFSLDLEQLRNAFERVDELGWNAFGWPDGDGPFISIEGDYRGHDVYLRVLAEAPEGEEPGAKLRVPRRPQR
jgi:hypothetical protein